MCLLDLRRPHLKLRTADWQPPQQVPKVNGLDEYMRLFPRRVSHSKTYRNPSIYRDKRVLVIGNSASGTDVTNGVVQTARLPVYQSRRTHYGSDHPPEGVEWKPVVKDYRPEGDIVFEDGSVLSDIDTVIYCTGYKASFPFWNTHANKGPIWDYALDKLNGSYLHTFFRDFPTLGIVGVPKVLTFRSFEYQAIALARVFAGRNTIPLPSRKSQVQWERERWRLVTRERRKFHHILWDNGETMGWLRTLFELAGLPLLEGRGTCPPVLNDETRWSIEHLRKYPERPHIQEEDGWTIVDRGAVRDSLHFI